MQVVLYVIFEVVYIVVDLDVLFQCVYEIIVGLLLVWNFFVVFYDVEYDELSFFYFVDDYDLVFVLCLFDLGMLSVEVVCSG